MSDARIAINLTADTGNALSGLQKVGTSVSVLQAQFERLQKLASMPNLNFRQQERLNSLLLKTQNELSKFERGINAANPKMERFTRANNQASASVFNFGRIIQDAPYAVLAGNIGAIANNIDPLVESFGRLKQTTGSAGGALKAMAGSLIGPAGIGVAISLVTSGLILFGDKIFGGSRAVVGFNRDLDNLVIAANNAKRAVEDFGKEVGFLNTIGGITVDINFDDKTESGLLKLRQSSVQIDREILNIEDNIKQAFDASNKAQDLLFSNLDRNVRAAIQNFGRLADVPEDLISGLSKADKRLFETARQTQSVVFDLQDKLTQKQREQSEARARIRLGNVEADRDAAKKAEEANKKALEDQQRFVDETIAKGKELAQFFKDRRPVPLALITNSPFTTREEQFKKAKEFIQQVKEGVKDLSTSKLQLPLTIEPIFKIEKKDLVEQFRKAVTEIRETFKNGTGLQDLKIPMPGFVAEAQAKGEVARLKYLEQLKDKMNAAAIAADFAADAFDGAFDALLSGESAIQAIGNALKQLVTDFIKATIRALLFKAITNLFAPGAGTISGGLANGARLIFGGGLAGLSQGLAPVGQAGRSAITPGNIQVNVQGSLIGRGNDLLGVITSTNRFNGRNG